VVLKIQFLLHKTFAAYYQEDLLMSFREIISVDSENHKKQVNTYILWKYTWSTYITVEAGEIFAEGCGFEQYMIFLSVISSYLLETEFHLLNQIFVFR
jgi:hypothetical protein